MSKTLLVAVCLALSAVLTSACFDKHVICPQLAAGNQCGPQFFIAGEPVKDHCPKSCNNCGGGGGTITPIGGAISTANCGQRPLGGGARVVNGQIATRGDWGWSVSLTRNGFHFCGGILINDRYVISAAHCFSNPSTVGMAVDLGMHNKDNKESWVQNRRVVYVKAHEAYNGQQMTNDIAILKLDRAVTFDTYVIPACVPESGTFDYQGKTGIVTGWGDQRYQSNQGSVEKRQGQQDILTDAKCTQKYANFRFNPTGQICAGEVTQYGGACQGDSGGPFSIKHTDGKWYAYGVVSFGLDCGYGTVYTRMSNYVNWIKGQMQSSAHL